MDYAKKNITIIMGLIASAFLLLLVVYPSFGQIKNLTNKISDLKLSLEKETGTTPVKETLTLYNTYEKKINILNSSLPSKNRELEFITALEDIAAKNNLKQKITFSQYSPLEKNIFFKRPLAISLSGNFAELINYLGEIEQLPFYININNLRVNKKEVSDENSEIFITANTYWR